ncbi:MAG: PD-(D/E)XK nuclease family protein [Verrucomicrobia bacterium]|nr:PD-(D/E)XK nuclease family protein [Verrucomicrobiota bacterium]MCH8513931.1 PD-(D/E)XK nuclease family protein [Kiritimatiellia bacterium]
MAKRIFLDWSRPLLPSITGRLLPERVQGPLDLGDTLIIAPTKQAARRLREHLAKEVRQRGGTAVLSSRVLPPSFFFQPEADTPVAHPFDWMHAWSETLRDLPMESLPALLPGREGSMSGETALEFGRRLQKVREELVEGDLDLAAVVDLHPLESEQTRWREMARLESLYRERLEHMGLEDPCDAKRKRAATFAPPEEVKRIILAGVPDPTPLILTTLARLQSQLPVEAWIHAPESEADHFDEWGRPDASWRTRHVGPESDPPGWIELCSDPSALCERAAQLLAEGPERPDLAFGMLDESLSGGLQNALAAANRKLYDPRPLRVSAQPPARLLALLHETAREGDSVSLRQLWRNPDLLRALPGSPVSLLAKWDRYAADHLPHGPDSVDETLADPELKTAWEVLKSWMYAESAEARLKVLQTVYGKVKLNPELPENRFALRAATEVADVLQEAARRGRDGREPSTEVVLRVLGEKSVDPPRVEGDVTAEGWLELSYHPAATLLLLGFGEGKVPGSRMSDAFLPDGLKMTLGLPADRDWLARDAFLFHSLVQCRATGAVRILCMKRDAQGAPAAPSRLLFQCGDSQLLERAANLFAEPPQGKSAPHAKPGLKLDLNRPQAKEITSISVTALKSYLNCPTRFYLSHVLRMECVDDTGREPDAAAFGSLLHGILDTAFASPASTVSELCQRMDALLDAAIQNRYGRNHGMAVRVMAHSARARLHAAVECQMRLLEEGWTAVATECKCEREINGMKVVGKIDRVDRHPEKGLRIIDYKTSDSPSSPKEAHLGGRKSEYEALWTEDEKGKPKQWTDLQLPLYRWLAETQDWLKPDEPLEVAYFQLPKAVGSTGIVTWAGEAEQAGSARTALAFLVSQIQAGVWGPPSENVKYDDFEALFHYGAEGISDCIPYRSH